MKANISTKSQKPTSYRYMDPEMIMTVVVSLVILSVGVFAFFVTINSLEDQNPLADSDDYARQNATRNVTDTGNSVFNVVGIVLIIGAIMTIVGLIYSYVR